MPTPCVVPLCTERKGGHRFPEDPALLYKWLLAIRRKNFKPSKFSRVCRNHFVPEDYVKPKYSFNRITLRQDAIPSIFDWTVEVLETEVVKKRKPHVQKEMSEIELDYQNLYSDSEPHEEDSNDARTNSSKAHDSIQENESLSIISTSIFNEYELLDDDESNEKQLIDGFENDDDSIKEYTGFESFENFMYVFSFFAEDVAVGLTKEIELSTHNQFFLTCMKLYLNKPDEELEQQFNIETGVVNSVFNDWINYLFFKLQNYKLWKPTNIECELEQFNKKKCCIYIIECSLAKKKCHGSYQKSITKKRNVLNGYKVIVIVSSSGNIIFVSECFDIKASDQEMFYYIKLDEILSRNQSTTYESQVIESLDNVQVKTVFAQKIQDLGKTFQILNAQEVITDNINRIIFVCFALKKILYNFHIKQDVSRNLI